MQMKQLCVLIDNYGYLDKNISTAFFKQFIMMFQIIFRDLMGEQSLRTFLNQSENMNLVWYNLGKFNEDPLMNQLIYDLCLENDYLEFENAQFSQNLKTTKRKIKNQP